MTPFSIHPDTTIGPVALAVSNLSRSERFYREVIGFKLLDRQGNTLTLTADGVTPLLILNEQQGARPRPPRTTGLYHFAILLPSRADLALALRHLATKRYPIQGAADHLVSEALYLADPDDNGIEIYRDRPRETWVHRNGQIQMATDPLDVDGIMGVLQEDDRPWEGLPPRTTIGHIHLNVADLRQAEAFYHDVLGFDIVTRYGPSALFISAGGYHHHIGLNTWNGVGASPPPPDAVGLRHFAIVLPNRSELERVAERVQQAGIAAEPTAAGILIRDPFQNGVVLTHSSITT